MRLAGSLILWAFLCGCVVARTETPSSATTNAWTSVPTHGAPATAVPTSTPTPLAQVTTLPTRQPAVSTLLSRSESPDGQWEAVTESQIEANGSGETVTLVVRSLIDTRSWTVETRSDPWRVVAAPWPFYWSSSGHVLYLTHRVIRVDGCFGADVANGTDLLALDLRTGDVEVVVRDSSGWLALSPDESIVAYVMSQPDRLILHDVRGAQERAVTVEILSNDLTPSKVTDLVWSPNQERVAATVRLHLCGEEVAEERAIVIFDIRELNQSVIWQGSERLETTGWDGEDRITLVDEMGAPWSLDVHTGIVKPAE